jgi:CHRD domain-containing protein
MLPTGPRLAEKGRIVLKEPLTMKRLALFALATLFVASACTSDTPSSASGPKPTFSAELKTSNENPPIQGAEATGSGNATVTFDLTRNSAGNVTAASATFVVNLSGFPPGTPIRIAHIHTGGSGVNGAIVVDTGLTPADGLTLTDGSGSFTKTNPSADPAIVQSILANPSAFYFNAHSAVNPGGVIRGQLDKVQ